MTIKSLIMQIPSSRRVVALLRRHLPNDSITLYGMTTRAEQDYYRTYAREVYSGGGEIVDLGCWLGSTTISLAQGLRKNRNRQAIGKHVHAYDLFTWEEWMDPYTDECMRRYSPGESYLDEYKVRTRRYSKMITIYPGDLQEIGWSGKPIEFLLVDAMKSWKLCQPIVERFYRSLLPKKGVLTHQDFKHWYTPWIHLVQYRLRDYFSFEKNVPNSGTLAFRLQREIDCDLTWLKDLRSFDDQEISDVFQYSMSLVDSNLDRLNIAAANVMHFFLLERIEEARHTLEEFIRQGFRVEGNLKFCQSILAIDAEHRIKGSVRLSETELVKIALDYAAAR